MIIYTKCIVNARIMLHLYVIAKSITENAKMFVNNIS